MGGSFAYERLRFQVERSDCQENRERGLTADLEENDFDRRLTCTGKIPNLAGAPIASWLLARLAMLTDDALGLEGTEDNDGGGYEVEFVVYFEPEYRKVNSEQLLLFNMDDFDGYVEPERTVAAFRFQADMGGAGVLGERDPDWAGEEILEAFAAALLAAPTELRSRELTVRDPEWKLDPEMYIPQPRRGSCNWYGWDGFQFLGKDNIR